MYHAVASAQPVWARVRARRAATRGEARMNWYKQLVNATQTQFGNNRACGPATRAPRARDMPHRIMHECYTSNCSTSQCVHLSEWSRNQFLSGEWSRVGDVDAPRSRIQTLLRRKTKRTKTFVSNVTAEPRYDWDLLTPLSARSRGAWLSTILENANGIYVFIIVNVKCGSLNYGGY